MRGASTQTGGVWLVGLSFVGVFCLGFFLGRLLLLLRWFICFGLVVFPAEQKETTSVQAKYGAGAVGCRACSRWVSKAWSGYLQCFPSHNDQLNTLSFLFLAPHSAHLTSPAAVQQVSNTEMGGKGS